MNKGCITYDDLLQSLNLSLNTTASTDSSVNQDTNAYAGLVYEACFQPLMLSRGPGFKLDRCMVGNEGNFLKAILLVLLAHNGGKENPVIEDLKVEMITFLKKTGSTIDLTNLTVPASPSFPPESMKLPYAGTPPPAAAAPPPPPAVVPPPTNYHPSAYENHRPTPPPSHHHRNKPPAAYTREDFAYAEEARALLHAGNEIERQEPILRLLAHLRKAGMDILFPQVLHDKILLCIFVAMRCANSLAHRELIDVVMCMKDHRAITQLDSLSRTKVRGVLALLKHAQMFITHGDEGEAVRLHLIPSIVTFKDLRDKHDAFINRCILQHHIFIPVTLKSELVWQLDPETKAMRVEELKRLENSLDTFLATGPGAAVIAPFIAIARSIHVPNSFPPTMQSANAALTGNSSPASSTGGGPNRPYPSSYSNPASNTNSSYNNSYNSNTSSYNNNSYSNTSYNNNNSYNNNRGGYSNNYSQAPPPPPAVASSNQYYNSGGGYNNADYNYTVPPGPAAPAAGSSAYYGADRRGYYPPPADNRYTDYNNAYPDPNSANHSNNSSYYPGAESSWNTDPQYRSTPPAAAPGPARDSYFSDSYGAYGATPTGAASSAYDFPASNTAMDPVSQTAFGAYGVGLGFSNTAPVSDSLTVGLSNPSYATTTTTTAPTTTTAATTAAVTAITAPAPEVAPTASFFFDQSDPFIQRTYREELLEGTDEPAAVIDITQQTEEQLSALTISETVTDTVITHPTEGTNPPQALADNDFQPQSLAIASSPKEQH